MTDDGYGVLPRALRSDPSPPHEVAHPAARDLFHRLASFPVSYEARARGTECVATIGFGPRSPRNRFSNKPFADDLIAVLSDAGVRMALLG